MMNRIKAKLRGRAGESIAETLIATLIAALALVMLAGAVASAARIVTTSRKAIEEYQNEIYDPINGLEKQWITIMENTLK